MGVGDIGVGVICGVVVWGEMVGLKVFVILWGVVEDVMVLKLL